MWNETRLCLSGPLRLQLLLPADLNFCLLFGDPCTLVQRDFMFS